MSSIPELWFDVEIEWITTTHSKAVRGVMLWFDVEIEWITTEEDGLMSKDELWFDVEIEWITTRSLSGSGLARCGLM